MGLSTELPWALLLALALVHVVLCPFTKVEESFNAQAWHDVRFLLLDGGGSLDAFDHHEFPGVVPRSFLGAWAVALCARPVGWALDRALPGLSAALGAALPGSRAAAWAEEVCAHAGLRALLAARLTLAVLTWWSLRRLGRAVGLRLGRDAERWLAVVCACQFHLVFYLGRPLPNTYALGLCALALARWLEGAWAPGCAWLALCTVALRCDTVILAGLVALAMLFSREATPLAFVVNGFASGLAALMLTVALDSLMWRRWLWPEGVVLVFNTVLNKSHEWGTMPWHWYASSALPRALMAALPLATLGALQPLDRLACARGALLDAIAIKYLAWPAAGYVALYSLLPHKELRFLFQALPFVNTLAALALAKLERVSREAGSKASSSSSSNNNNNSNSNSNNNTRGSCGSARRGLARAALFAAAGALAASCAVAQISLYVAMHNYPGAEALLAVQRDHASIRSANANVTKRDTVKVHYCVLAAMSGITRFLEHGSAGIEYSKREDTAFSATLCNPASGFDYLVIEPQRWRDEPACRDNYRLLRTVHGKPVFEWRNRAVRTEPALLVLKASGAP
jgi:alpha-1,6-mannosyltransferase